PQRDELTRMLAGLHRSHLQGLIREAAPAALPAGVLGLREAEPKKRAVLAPILSRRRATSGLNPCDSTPATTRSARMAVVLHTPTQFISYDSVRPGLPRPVGAATLAVGDYS